MKKILVALLAATLLYSCKDDEVTPTDTPSIPGFWSGTWNTVNPFHLLFRTNGTVRVYDGADTSSATIGEGTWTISNDSVRTYYSYNGIDFGTIAAGVDADSTEMTGTWGIGTNTTNGGTVEFTKQ